MLLRPLPIILALALLTSVAHGQAPSQSTPSTTNVPQTLTLDDAIRLATERNYAIRTAANRTRVQDMEVSRTTDNMWLPSVNASGKWGYGYSLTPLSERTRQIITMDSGSVRTESGNVLLVNGFGANSQQVSVTTPAGSHSLSWGASANLNLFNGGSDLASVHAAQSGLEAAQQTQKWTRQNIAFDVTGNFLNVLRTGELVDAAMKTLEETSAQLALIRGKYEAGVVPIGQVYQQEAVVQQDSLGLIQARNNYENAKADVLFQLNVPPNEYNSYGFSASGIDTTATVLSSSDTDITNAHINVVIDARSDILAQRSNIAAQEYAISVTRGALLPSLDASVGIGGSGTNQDLSKIRVNNDLSAGLALSVPIFDKMQTRLKIEEQEVELENQRIQLEQDVQQLRSDAAKAVNNIRSSAQALDASQAALRSAEESMRLATERLRVGAGTQVDLVVAESQVTSARTNRVNARYNYVLAKRQLAYTLGQWNY
jgi:outer membrane protein